MVIPSFVPKSQIEAVLSVIPSKMTHPRQSRRVALATTDIDRHRCLHTLLFYNKTTEDDSGRVMAGWIKESLGRALSEQPLFGGRLHQAEGHLAVVTNDSGVRLVEASIEITLGDFLDMKERVGVEGDDQLVFWKDVDEQNPQYSPLCYVQVTKFECGGYSIGISCSLLLADPFFMTSFLKRWASIHNTMLFETDLPELPLFFHPNCRRTGLPDRICSNSTKNTVQTMLFEITGENLDSEEVAHKTLPSLCIEKAEDKFNKKIGPRFSLFVKDSNGDIRVETGSKQACTTPSLSYKTRLTCLSWGDLGTDEVAFHKKNKPACVSYWIGLNSNNEGVVMVTPSCDEVVLGVRVFITIPSEEI